MPRTSQQLPENGKDIKFRVTGEKILREGKYKDNKFQACSPFLCVEIDGVDYWRYRKSR